MNFSPSPRFVAVILDGDRHGRDGDDAFKPTFAGHSAAEILQERLNRLPALSARVYWSPQRGAGDVTARRLGWRLLRPGRWLAGIGALWALARADYWLFFDLRHPFVDVASCQDLLSDLEPDRLYALGASHGAGVSPMFLVARGIAWRALARRFRRPSAWQLARALRAEATVKRTREVVWDMPPIMAALRADLSCPELVDALGGKDLDVRSVRDGLTTGGLDANKALSLARAHFHREMLASSTPHVWNERLLALEAALECPEVMSYPSKVVVDITSRCNARCGFCNHPVLAQHTRDRFSLEDFQRMDWLKYVSLLGFSGRLGDPFTHRQCLDIVRYVAEAHPHLELFLTTNGIALDETASRALVGRLARLSVSLNAATEPTWRAVMGVKGFDKVCANLRTLRAIKQAADTVMPRLKLTMVVTRRNLDEMAAFVELAQAFGAAEVEFDHFTPAHMPGCAMGADESAYRVPDLYDRGLAEARALARRHGIELFAPPPFTVETGLFEAKRAWRPPSRCVYPWSSLLLADNAALEPKVEICCTAFDPGLRYSPQDLHGATFTRLWNHPHLRRFRETVNLPGGNPACELCRRHDQQDPDDTSIHILQSRLDAWLGAPVRAVPVAMPMRRSAGEGSA